MLTLVHEWNYNSLKCLAVVNDGYHILYITLRQLPVSQVLFFVAHRLLPVPANKTHIVTGKDVSVVCSLTCSLNGCNYYSLLATFNLENRGLLWTMLRVFILGPMLQDALVAHFPMKWEQKQLEPDSHHNRFIHHNDPDSLKCLTASIQWLMTKPHHAGFNCSTVFQRTVWIVSICQSHNKSTLENAD